MEDNGEVAYLYLTEAHLTRIAAAAWVYNHTNFPVIPRPRGSADGTGSGALDTCRDHAARNWALLWSKDGNSVAVLADDFPLAYIVNATNPGYSRGLKVPNSLGNTWDDAIYARVFGRV